MIWSGSLIVLAAIFLIHNFYYFQCLIVTKSICTVCVLHVKIINPFSTVYTEYLYGVFVEKKKLIELDFNMSSVSALSVLFLKSMLILFHCVLISSLCFSDTCIKTNSLYAETCRIKCYSGLVVAVGGGRAAIANYRSQIQLVLSTTASWNSRLFLLNQFAKYS